MCQFIYDAKERLISPKRFTSITHRGHPTQRYIGNGLEAKEESNLVIKWLIENGMDVNIGVRFGNKSLLFSAIRHKNVEMINYLVEKGANVNQNNRVYERGISALTPLHDACSYFPDIVPYLLDHGARHGGFFVDCVHEVAIRCSQKEILYLLLEYDIYCPCHINCCKKHLLKCAKIYQPEWVDEMDQKIDDNFVNYRKQFWKIL